MKRILKIGSRSILKIIGPNTEPWGYREGYLEEIIYAN